MIGKSEVSKALDGAFRAAFMLTGSMQAAEHAVLNGIAATECYGAGDDAFLLETIKAAIQTRADSPHQSRRRCAQLPLELRRLFLLPPISRDCFVLRILLGIPVGTCSTILHRRVEDIEDVLCVALQDLARLEARSIAGARNNPDTRVDPICRSTVTKKVN
jgi:hypothetical protein